LPSVVDLNAFRATPLTREPFNFLVVRDFVRPEARTNIDQDFPCIPRGGSFPVEVLEYGVAFARLVEELNGAEVRRAFEEKFSIDLMGRPTMTTVRGRCTTRDGNIHTDSETKIITALIYLNPDWCDAGGRFRLLRSAKDLDDVIVEVLPERGALVAFRRSANSYHGHTPFVGERRVVQFNWITEEKVVRRELMRHRVSARIKRFMAIPSLR
jgi:SM-20-related protein